MGGEGVSVRGVSIGGGGVSMGGGGVQVVCGGHLVLHIGLLDGRGEGAVLVPLC